MFVNAETYSSLHKQGSIYVGHQRCKYFDDFNLQNCSNCQGYHHSKNKCTKEIKCKKCAGSHNFEECNSTEIQCTNCMQANEYLKKKRCITH